MSSYYTTNNNQFYQGQDTNKKLTNHEKLNEYELM